MRLRGGALLGDVTNAIVEDHDAVPFGPLFALAGLPILQVSLVASDRLTTFWPFCVVRTSGSLPRFPTKITLFTLPASHQPLLCSTRALPMAVVGTCLVSPKFSS
jgi:hypothetical protein